MIYLRLCSLHLARTRREPLARTITIDENANALIKRTDKRTERSLLPLEFFSLLQAGGEEGKNVREAAALNTDTCNQLGLVDATAGRVCAKRNRRTDGIPKSRGHVNFSARTSLECRNSQRLAAPKQPPSGPAEFFASFITIASDR